MSAHYACRVSSFMFSPTLIAMYHRLREFSSSSDNAGGIALQLVVCLP
jgi:hypothetical protein